MTREIWTMFWYGSIEQVCTRHKTLAAAKKALERCEERGGARHRIVEVKTIQQRKPRIS